MIVFTSDSSSNRWRGWNYAIQKLHSFLAGMKSLDPLTLAQEIIEGKQQQLVDHVRIDNISYTQNIILN